MRHKRTIDLVEASQVPKINVQQGKAAHIGNRRDSDQSLLFEAKSAAYNYKTRRQALSLVSEFQPEFNICLVGPASVSHVIAQTTDSFEGEYSTLGNLNDPNKVNPAVDPDSRMIDSFDVFVVFEHEFVAPALLNELLTLAENGEAVVVLHSDHDAAFSVSHTTLIERVRDRVIIDLDKMTETEAE